MNLPRSIVVCLSIALFSLFAPGPDATANDYVWARTGFGSAAAGRHFSAFSNGYGGYYVPRNASGNNHESNGRFTNPNGYIVPAQGSTYTMGHRRFR